MLEACNTLRSFQFLERFNRILMLKFQVIHLKIILLKVIKQSI